MKKIVISILLIIAVFPVAAQSEVETVLKEIESNNTTLSALREQAKAQKLSNRTDIYLPNPEVEFNYLWGSPTAIGDRKDISVTQSFDFPTAYGHKNKISKLENANVDLMYKAERMELLLRAKQVCIELVYYNALAKEYSERLANAGRIAEVYQAKFDKGEANILENNKAQLNLTTVSNEMNRIEIERASLLSELKSLNGGLEILFTTAEVPNELLPVNFEDWYASAEAGNPVLQYVKGEVEISRQQVKLNTAMALPKFTTGYMSEKVVGERFQGITVGMSVPLWENKNKIKYAKAQVIASETMLEDTRIQFYNKLQNLFFKSSGLQENAFRYREALASYDNVGFLKKALDAGEIPLLNYLLEMEYYYDAMNKVLEAERDFRLSVAELSAVEL